MSSPGYISSKSELDFWLREHKQSQIWLEQIQEHSFPIRVPIQYATLIHWNDLHDPLALMVLPTSKEHIVMPYELSDPIGDQDREAVPGLIHRYSNRALLLLTMHCRVHCRFCFRRDVVSKVRPVNITKIREYLHEHTEIEEIIFSGGDPLSFSPDFLDSLLHSLPQNQVRFHSRIPVVDPDFVSNRMVQFLKMLALEKTVRIILHINHPRELSNDVKKLIQQFQEAGIELQSQTVLLKGINHKAGVLFSLWNSLLGLGVQPKYLHHLDRAMGTHQFRVSLEEGLGIFSREKSESTSANNLRYVIDLPGGKGKIDVSSLKKVGESNSEYVGLDKDGNEVRVCDMM